MEMLPEAQQLGLFHTDGAPPVAAPRALGQQCIIVGDCLVEMRQMPAESIDVIVTSPPYNQGIDYASYNDSRPQREYLAWLGEVGAEMRRLMRPCASFFLNVGGTGAAERDCLGEEHQF